MRASTGTSYTAAANASVTIDLRPSVPDTICGDTTSCYISFNVIYPSGAVSQTKTFSLASGVPPGPVPVLTLQLSQRAKYLIHVFIGVDTYQTNYWDYFVDMYPPSALTSSPPPLSRLPHLTRP